MAKSLFIVFFKIITTIVGSALSPINNLVTNLFPDFSNLISTFNYGVTNYIIPKLSYFSVLIPPNTRTFIVLYLTFLITYYSMSFTLHLIVKIFKVIQRVKFW